MNRPIRFAIEVAAGMMIATTAAWISAKFSGKLNRTAQAEERIAAALERLANR